MIAGLEKSCYKRAISGEQLREIIDTAEEQIFKKFDKEVPSIFIGDALSVKLREIDKIAYVRFASVYRDFTDVGELIDEAQEANRHTIVGPEQGELFSEQE